jgi:AcrR family transcriptional regulator
MPALAPARRKASREHRREQLIEATISVIARKGYAQTTLADVAQTAGVSHGLVLFHFRSKELLFSETLRFMSETYRRIWSSALAAAAPDGASQLSAIIEANFSDEVCSSDWLAAWVHFWTETECRPIYTEQCAEDDLAYVKAIEAVCSTLAREGGYAVQPVRAARILRLTIEGVWLDLMFPINGYAREEARATVYYCASTLFPRHFTEDGMIRR